MATFGLGAALAAGAFFVEAGFLEAGALVALAAETGADIWDELARKRMKVGKRDEEVGEQEGRSSFGEKLGGCFDLFFHLFHAGLSLRVCGGAIEKADSLL